MFDSIKDWKIIKEGKCLATKADIDEALEVLDFLVKFSMGYTRIDKNNNRFSLAVKQWFFKLAQTGYSAKKLLLLISGIASMKSENLHQNTSLQALIAKGTDIIGGSLKKDTIVNDNIDAFETRIKTLTKIQKRYYDLFTQGMSNDNVTRLLNKSPSVVSKMRTTLGVLFVDLKDNLFPEPDLKETVIYPSKKC